MYLKIEMASGKVLVLTLDVFSVVCHHPVVRERSEHPDLSSELMAVSAPSEPNSRFENSDSAKSSFLKTELLYRKSGSTTIF
tara:strand:- start:79 stop:324 length:246 start_codon:yes stop_codon:yes gene_type:complete